MSNTIRNVTLAMTLMLGTVPLMSMQAEAKSNFMADCGAKFKAAKAAGTPEGALKWTDFMKTQCAADAMAPAPVAPAATPAATTMKKKMPAVVALAPAAPAAATTTTTTASGSFMQNCGAAWKAMKAAGTQPAGMKWKDFVAAKCVVDGAAPAAPATAAAATATKPMVSTAAAAKPVIIAPTEPGADAIATPLAAVDKNGKPYSEKQIAAHKRIRACSDQWRAAKTGGTLPVGQKWPQFWSACNTQLKAAGQ